MKRFTRTALIACTSLFTALGAQAAPEKIVVGLDDNFPPMGFRDKNSNELVGYDIDMAREAASRMGVQVEFKPIEWSAKEAELNGKRIDALWNGLTITEERKRNIAFTKPYMTNHQIIVVPKDSAIQSKAELAGKNIGLQDGSTAVQAVEKDPVAKLMKNIKKYGDNVTALLDLAAGRTDAVVVDEVVGRYYISNRPQQYRVLEEHFGEEEYGVGVRLDDSKLLQALDSALDAMKADGSADKIHDKWFGEHGPAAGQ